MLASRFLDPVVGIDIHFELTPMGVPAPFPNPFIGLTWDPGGLLVGQAMGYAMALATGTPPTGPVLINLRPATNVGTEATNSLGVPHILIPPGVSWAPMPKPPKPAFKGPPDPPGPPVMPEGDAVHIMGSQTVTVMGSSAVRMGDLAMSCGEPVRLPSSTALSIPMGAPVLIGGPPSISLQDALGALVRTKWVAGHLHALLSRIRSDRLRNLLSKAVCFLTGHPVDVATGRVLTDAVDFELPGALPIRLERHYSSAWANRAGALGHGWSHSLDQAVWPERGKVVYLDAEGREIEFDTFDFPDHRLPVGNEVYEPISRLTLKAYGKGRYAVTTHDGVRREFETIEARGSGRPRRSRLVRERSREGAHLRYTYDELGNLARVADPNGRQALLEHDAQGRLIATHLPHPTEPGRFLPHSRYEYDAAGDLVRATDALGQSFSYEYQTHLLTRETNRNGLSFYFAYDSFGEDAFCTRTWGDGGIYDHVITYDKAGKVTLVKNSLGYTTSYFMNAVGLVTKVVDPLGNTTQYGYHEPSLQRSSLVDPAGAATTWEYDARGNCTRIAYPDGATVGLEYDARNLPVQATDALGGAWRWSYDSEGRLIARSDPLARSTQFHWDAYRLNAVTDPAGQHTRLTYDAAGNLDSLVGPDGTTSRWQHDARGRCHTVIDPNDNAQRREHDLLGRVTRVAEPDGNLRELEYDPEGNVVHARDRDHDVRFEYHGMGRLAARTEAGTRVEFRYDTEEQLVSIVNEHGAVYRFVLDPAGNVAEEHGFDGLRRKYQRDKAGRVSLIFRPASATSKYAYDAAGRVTRIEHSDGANEAYAYRLDGELVRAQNAAVTLEFDRDLLGRMTEERSGEHWVTSEYDALGRRTTVRSSKGLEQRIRRNAMGDVLAVEARVNGESPRGPEPKPSTERPSSVPPPPTSRRFGEGEPRDAFRVDFERDRLGLELERRLPGGVQARWQRDSLGRPQVQEIRVRGVTQQARQYTWETNDRLRMIIDSMSGPIHYTHDSLGNLAAASYQDGRVDLRMPDAVGNLFKTSDRADRKYGPAGQLLEARDARGVTRYEYDAEGNLYRKLEPDGREWRYRWSLTGMLVEVKRPDGETVGFAYDALGRRWTKSFRGKTTHWIWDGNVPLHEWIELTDEAIARDGEPLRNSFEREVAQAKRKAHLSRRTAQGPPELVYPGGAPRREDEEDAEPLVLEGTADAPATWLFEPESFAPLGKIVADERYSVVTDHLGTPRAMFDAHGQEVWAAEIDTYGQLQNLRGARRACPFRFPGQYEDEETGLYYNRFRYYDPEAGGYVSQDPIGLAGGRRLYGYVLDPTRNVDHNGLSCTQPRPGFYARQDGTLVPSQGYRHVSSNAPYLADLVKTGRMPANSRGTYLSFTRIDDLSTAPGLLQVPHDAAIRIEFDTADIADELAIPRGKWGEADYLEPITKDFPEFGPGGATQAITRQPIQATRIVDLRTGNVLYGR
jgi:RHS repeat-associated protein